MKKENKRMAQEKRAAERIIFRMGEQNVRSLFILFRILRAIPDRPYIRIRQTNRFKD